MDVARDPEGVKQRIGYMSQRFSLYELLTVDQNIAFFGGIYGLDEQRLARRRDFVLEMAGLKGRETTLARDLSGGWRQRLALGCAILHEPTILFLDEPTGGVDPLSRRQFWRLIDVLSNAGVTVLVTTHYLDEAERCHRVALIHAGKLATLGTPTEVKSVFAGRPILEIRSPNPVEVMRALDAMPEVEKTSLFGTAVHAVLRSAALDTATIRAASARRRPAASQSLEPVTPSLEDVFLDVVETGGVMTRALAVGRKEFRQIRRDSRTLMILVFVPAFFLLLYGYALNFDIRHVALAVEDRDSTSESRSVVSAFVNSSYFDLVASVYSPREAEQLLDRNTVRAVLVIPEGFGRRLAAWRNIAAPGDHQRRQRQHRHDRHGLRRQHPARRVRIARSRDAYRGAAARDDGAAHLVQPRAAQHAVPRAGPHRLHRHDHGGGLHGTFDRSREGSRDDRAGADGPDWDVLVHHRQDHSLLHHLAGVRPHSIILASMALFGLPMRGSWLALLLALSLFLVGALATGLLISTISDTQQVAFQIALLISLLPTIMLSGFIFPIASMPRALQVITTIVPARYFLVALRGIVLKGAPLSHLLIPLAALAVYAAAMLGLASVRLAKSRGV